MSRTSYQSKLKEAKNIEDVLKISLDGVVKLTSSKKAAFSFLTIK
jgi:hypothetical protein